MASLLPTSRTEAGAVAVRHELQRLANDQATYVHQVRQAVARVLAERRVRPCTRHPKLSTSFKAPRVLAGIVGHRSIDDTGRLDLLHGIRQT